MEAFISRMIDAGPAANRPPHMLLEPSPLEPVSRALMILLLAAGLAACDRQSPPAGQANASMSGEVPASGNATTDSEAFNYRLDRSKAGTAAPTFAFQNPDGGDIIKCLGETSRNSST